MESLGEWLAAATNNEAVEKKAQMAALELLHPFSISLNKHLSRLAVELLSRQDCAVDCNGWNGTPAYMLREILCAPKGRYSTQQKAYAWLWLVDLDYIKEKYLGALVEMQVPGYEDFQNLSEDCFYGFAHPMSDEDRMRPAYRLSVEPFLKGHNASESAIAFLQALENDSAKFTPRQMFLYSCANCRSLDRFKYIVKHIKRKLGSGNFVDALGYSPFFYTIFRNDSIAAPVCEGDDPVDSVPMDKFLGVIRSAGARPNRKCRYGFSWEDVESVVEEFKVAKFKDCRLSRHSGPFAISSVPDLKPMPSAEEIEKLMIESPEEGLFEIERMTYEPESLEKPFGAREKIVSDVICDTRVAAETRARLLWGFSHGKELARSSLEKIRGDLPLCFQESYEGRKWYCDRKKSGYRDVLCSDSFFFKLEYEIKAKYEYQRNGRIASKAKSKADQMVIDAIESDSPSRFMMAITVGGMGLHQKYYQEVLRRRKMTILKYLMENDDGVRDLLDQRRLLFYICANWEPDLIVKYVEESEKETVGIVKECVDSLGHNLLWYLLYNECMQGDCSSSFRRSRCEEAVKTLTKYGADPDKATKWGISWNHMVKAATAGFCYDVFVNDAKVEAPVCLNTGTSRGYYGDGKVEAKEVRTIKVVMRGSEKSKEWMLAKYSPKFLQGIMLSENEFIVRLSRTPNEYGEETVFQRSRDGLFRIEDGKSL